MWLGVHYTNPTRKTSARGCDFDTMVSVIYHGDDQNGAFLLSNSVMNRLRGQWVYGAPRPENPAVRFDVDGQILGSRRTFQTKTFDESVRQPVARPDAFERAYYRRSPLW